jgi:predicted permease
MRLNFTHALRHLRRRPALTAVGVLSLAIGIGCALACASVVNTVLFRAFPYRDADRLVLVWENNAKRGVGLTPTSILNFKDLQAGAGSFESLGAFGDALVSLDTTQGSERAVAYRTSAGLLEQTRVQPALGRLFTGDEDKAGAPDVAVLSYGLWQRRFGGNRHIVGQEIRLSGVPHTIVGVMPRGFLLPPVFSIRLVNVDLVIKEADVWVPFKMDALPQRRDARMLFVLGRLKDGRAIDQARAEASTIGGRLAADYPVDDFGLDFTVIPLEQQVLSRVRTLLLLLLVVGVLVLIIAATDAAHLLLADALTMTGETAVRAALGATAWRLASQQATLGLVWCALATGGALVVSAAFAAPIATYAKANVPRLSDVRLDGTVGALSLAIGAGLSLAVSLLPILYARRTSTTRSAAATAAPTGMPAWRRAFVIVQLAVAIVVLSTAALLFRSAFALARVNPGFVAEGVSALEVMLPTARYPTPAARAAFDRRVLDEMATLPGTRTAVVDYVPLGDSASIVNFTVEHRVAADAMAKPRAALRSVSASYFDVLAIPTIAGRRLAPHDEGDDSTAVVVNDAFARRYLAVGEAVGQRIKRGEANAPSPWLTVAGVVGSVRGAGLGIEPQPEVFIPFVKGGARPTRTLLVKSAAPASALAPAVAQRIHRVDAGVSPMAVAAMTEIVGRASGQPFFYARLFGVLGIAAFVLSLAGIYGVAALGVSARSNEIAIRSCLGAQPADLVRLILRETAVAVCPAVMAGALGAWMLQRRVAAFVYGVESTDWLVIAASALALSVLALAVVYVAVRRVLNLRPMDLLKHGVGALA